MTASFPGKIGTYRKGGADRGTVSAPPGAQLAAKDLVP